MTTVLNRTERAIDLCLEYKGAITTITIPPAQNQDDPENPGNFRLVSGREEVPDDFLKEVMKRESVAAHFDEKRLAVKKSEKVADTETAEQKKEREAKEADKTIGAPSAPPAP